MDFLIDQGKKLSYEEIIRTINSSNSFFDSFVYPDLSSFFINWIFALVNNQDIQLVDADITTRLFDDEGFRTNSKIVVGNPKKIKSIEDLVEAIRYSTSNITLFTSGTTGFVKKISHPVSNLIRKINISSERANDVWAFAFNPTHVAGVQVFFQTVLNQNTMVNLFLCPKELVLEDILKFKITNISSTPTFYRLLIPFDKVYSSVRKITIGGEKSDSKLIESINSAFPNARINNVYGSTETGPLFSSENDEFAIPDAKRHLIKVENNELFIHQDLFGKNDKLNLVNGFYATGDLIEWLNMEETKFKFVSRKHEIINVGGYKVNPYEVEEELLNIDCIKNVRVFGQTNSVLGQIVGCEIQLRDNQSLLEKEVRSFLTSKLQNYKIPRKIIFVKEIELTRTGKKKIA